MNSINKIGLGTVQFGVDYGISNSLGKTNEFEVQNILSFSSEQGISIVDTASAYGDSETILGRNNLAPFKIVSKFLLNSDSDSVLDHLELTLTHLNQRCIYGYLAHRPMSIVENPKIWDLLNYAKSIGKVKKIGFSFNDTDELKKVLDAGFVPDIVQVPFNYFDRRFALGISELRELNCEIHTRSAFLQGLFFCNVEDLDPFFNEIRPVLLELQQYGDLLPAMLLDWVVKHDFIDHVIVGVNNKKQLRENLEALKSLDPLVTLPVLVESISENILTPSLWPNNS
jgi:aryl-alcohol dehydrogenase-like predicted oxidoreductase